MKCKIQIMGMSFSSVFHVNNYYNILSSLFFFHTKHAPKGEQCVVCSKCHYSSKHPKNSFPGNLFFISSKKRIKEKLHI